MTTSFSRSGSHEIASAIASRISVSSSADCGFGPASSSIVSMSAIWSPPAETVQSSSSAAIDVRPISDRLSFSSSSLTPSFPAISSSVGARPRRLSRSVMVRSISRARARTERGTQSSARSSSMIDPRMRAIA